MMKNKWNVLFTNKAYKQLKRLSKSLQTIVDEAVLDLETNGPKPPHWDIKKTGQQEYRLRINYRYRMRYLVKNKEVTIEIFYVGHRKEAYS